MPKNSHWKWIRPLLIAFLKLFGYTVGPLLCGLVFLFGLYRFDLHTYLQQGVVAAGPIILGAFFGLLGLPVFLVEYLAAGIRRKLIRKGTATFLVLFAYMVFIAAYSFILLALQAWLLQVAHRPAFNLPDISGDDMLYFSLITITTVGYGDFVPVAGIIRVIVSAEILTGLLLHTLLFALLAAYLIERPDEPAR